MVLLLLCKTCVAGGGEAMQQVQHLALLILGQRGEGVQHVQSRVLTQSQQLGLEGLLTYTATHTHTHTQDSICLLTCHVQHVLFC